MPGSGNNKLDVVLKPLGAGFIRNEREEYDLKLRTSEIKSTLQKYYCQHLLAAMSCKAQFNAFYNYPMHALSLLTMIKSIVAGLVSKHNPLLSQVLSMIVAVLAFIQLLLFHSNKLASLDMRSRLHRIHSSKIFALLENARDCHDEGGLATLEAAFNTIDGITASVLSMPEKIRLTFDLMSCELKIQRELSQKFNNKKGISSTEADEQLFYHEILYYSYQELSYVILKSPRCCFNWCYICGPDRWLVSLPDPQFVVQATLDKIKERIMCGNSTNLFASPSDSEPIHVVIDDNGVEEVSMCSSTESGE